MPPNRRAVRIRLAAALGVLAIAGLAAVAAPPARTPTFAIELTGPVAERIADLGLEVPVTGRAYVILTRDGEREPRRQVGVQGVPFWGREVRGMSAGDEVTLVPGGDGVIGGAGFAASFGSSLRSG